MQNCYNLSKLIRTHVRVMSATYKFKEHYSGYILEQRIICVVIYMIYIFVSIYLLAMCIFVKVYFFMYGSKTETTKKTCTKHISLEARLDIYAY
jgi:hypothetical protein